MVGRGYHVALTREHAKRLFAIKEDVELRQFLDELISSPDLKKKGRVIDSGIMWDPIHRCLTEGELDPTGGEFPLNTAVLGGKQLHQGKDYAAVLVRPDMCTFIAEAIAEVDEVELKNKFQALTTYTQPKTDKEFSQLWRILKLLQVFFEAAAEDRDAVVFTAKYEA